MEPSKRALIEIKKAAGMASEAEIEALLRTPLIVGEGLCVGYPSNDVARWSTRWADARLTELYAHNAPQPDDAQVF